MIETQNVVNVTPTEGAGVTFSFDSIGFSNAYSSGQPDDAARSIW